MPHQNQVIVKVFTKPFINVFIGKSMLNVAVKMFSSVTSIVASLFTIDPLELFSDTAAVRMGYSPY